MWFWRDLRLRDLPTLIRAGEDADVVPLFVLDPRLLRNGEPTSVVAELVREVRADEVHISTETTPYGTARNRPDRPGTCHMSTDLKYGTIHLRTMLFDIARHEAAHSAGAERYITELCWREFYADVLWHHPASAGSDYRPLPGMQYDDLTGDTAVLVEAWWAGRTRFPLVDAGMRQLLTEGWMHYRVRLVTASFLVKDLHVWWPAGARHFLAHLRDGDIASNNHGWQWCAGTGTDAAPYFRFFNPVAQGKRFDANGDYVRRYIPELRHVPGAAVHEPWAILDCCPHVYPEPIVDHAKQRRETLARYEQGGGR